MKQILQLATYAMTGLQGRIWMQQTLSLFQQAPAPPGVSSSANPEAAVWACWFLFRHAQEIIPLVHHGIR